MPILFPVPPQVALDDLPAKVRLLLTGTPVQNDLKE